MACSAPPTASLERFGPQRVFDTPISESAIVGASRRPVGRRARAGGRDPVRRLQPCRRTTRSSGSSPACGTAAGALPLPGHRARAVRRRRPHARAPRRLGRGAVRAHARARASWCRRTRPTPRGCSPARSASDDPVLVLRADPAATARRARCPTASTSCRSGRARGRARARRRGRHRVGRDGRRRGRGGRRRAATRAARDVGVVDLRTLAPLDIETIVRAAERCGRVVVVHEAPLTAGFGAEVVATLQEEAFYSLEAPIRRVAGVRRRLGAAAGRGLVPPRRRARRRRARRVARCVVPDVAALPPARPRRGHDRGRARAVARSRSAIT